MRIKLEDFTEEKMIEDDVIYRCKTEKGFITVLDRMTGFGDGTIRDIETGFKSLKKDATLNSEGHYNFKDFDFWLASGDFDIRTYIGEDGMDLDEAIKLIKENANTVNPGD